MTIMINGKPVNDGLVIGKCGTCAEESADWCDGCNEHQTTEVLGSAVAPGSATY